MERFFQESFNNAQWQIALKRVQEDFNNYSIIESTKLGKWTNTISQKVQNWRSGFKHLKSEISASWALKSGIRELVAEKIRDQGVGHWKYQGSGSWLTLIPPSICLCGAVVACGILNWVAPGSLPHGSHCVIEAGRMCKLTVALTSGWLVH